MRRFQNATMEYNASKNDLVIRDVNTNGIFLQLNSLKILNKLKEFLLYILLALK